MAVDCHSEFCGRGHAYSGKRFQRLNRMTSKTEEWALTWTCYCSCNCIGKKVNWMQMVASPKKSDKWKMDKWKCSTMHNLAENKAKNEKKQDWKNNVADADDVSGEWSFCKEDFSVRDSLTCSLHHHFSPKQSNNISASVVEERIVSWISNT